MQALGVLSKNLDRSLFISEIQSWHFGTLFSKNEAFGISNRECLALGVPVITHSIGGIPSTLIDDGCGKIFPPHPGAIEVAKWIKSCLTPYEHYLLWRGNLAKRWHEFTWDATVDELKKIIKD